MLKKIHELSDTVIHAAEAIGCKPEEIEKNDRWDGLNAK